MTFFGEMLPEDEIAAAQADCGACALLLVVGTSAEVEPAAGLPRTACDAGARVWEVNPKWSRWLPAHHRLTAPAEEALPPVADRLAAEPHWRRPPAGPGASDPR